MNAAKEWEKVIYKSTQDDVECAIIMQQFFSFSNWMNVKDMKFLIFCAYVTYMCLEVIVILNVPLHLAGFYSKMNSDVNVNGIQK